MSVTLLVGYAFSDLYTVPMTAFAVMGELIDDVDGAEATERLSASVA